jgi:hypothetical protein
MKPEISQSYRKRQYPQPRVFVDPTDDGPEVDILRQGKVIIRQGDNFVLGFIPPKARNRNYAYPC